jgi:hypothetical protein
LNHKKPKKNVKKKKLMATDSSNRVKSILHVYENNAFTSVHKEVNLSSFHHKEEKDMTKIFNVKIQVKKSKANALFDSGSHANIIEIDLIKKLGLDVHDHPSPYPLGWINKDEEIKVMKGCMIKFVVSVDFIDEVELDVIPLDMCGVVFGSPYVYMRDAILMQRANHYHMIKDGKYFIINVYKGK